MAQIELSDQQGRVLARIIKTVIDILDVCSLDEHTCDPSMIDKEHIVQQLGDKVEHYLLPGEKMTRLR